MRKTLFRSLARRRDFELAFREGSRQVSKYLVIYARPNGLIYDRLGLAVSKKLGTAVTRNRIKRLLREAVRKGIGKNPQHGDFVIVARNSAAEGTLEDFIRAVKKVLSRFEHEKSSDIADNSV